MILKKYGTKVLGYNVLGKIEDINNMKKNTSYVIAIGNNYIREQIYQKYKMKLYTAIHPTAVIAKDVSIGEGTVVMANACINSSAKIGKNCIINTGVIVEHENIIEDYVHISPNATLAGNVKIGKFTHIGAGATVINNKTITSNCIIGAGATVVKDINKKGTYVGIPAKLMKSKE